MKTSILISLLLFQISFSQKPGHNTGAIDTTGFCIRPDSSWEKLYQFRLEKMAIREEGWPIENGNNDSDAGKRAWPALLANMYRDRQDTIRLLEWINDQGKELIFSRYAGSFYKPFTCPGYALYFFQYKDLLPQSQIDTVRDRIYQNGWTFMMRPDHHMDPIYKITEFNSENFNWMARLIGYLFAEEFEDDKYIEYFENYIDNWVRAPYYAGRVEWDSNIYFAYCFQPVLVLHQFAKKQKVKNQAKAVLDWMLITAALHYLDGFQVGADVRAKTQAFKPFNGSTWFYSYLYFVDAEHHPSFPQELAFENAKHHYAGFALHSDYRPLCVAVDIAQRKFSTPIEMHNAKPFYLLDNNNYQDWRGNTINSRRFEFETLYLEENYTMSSVATFRPYGNARMNTQGQKMFSEQSMWRLGIKGTGKGAIQIFGNSGDETDMAGRCRYEEIGQYRNVMMRLIKGANNMWVACPKNRHIEICKNILFVDLQNDVYAAFYPFQARDMNQSEFNENYYRFTWLFDSDKLGALILEVGTLEDHGTFLNFKDMILNQTHLNSPFTNQLEYTSTFGKKLLMKYMPTTSYTLIDGTVIDSAGVIPRVWCDGKEIDFKTWNSYEVVYGERIVDQKWGSGILRAIVNGKGLEIIVEPEDASIRYKTIQNSKR